MPIYELNQDLALMNLCETFDLKSFKAFGHYRNNINENLYCYPLGRGYLSSK